MSNAWWDREEDAIIDDINAGRISQHEGNRELAELRREYTEASREAAQAAYDDEMGRW